jgi:hypothetical protein
LTSAKSVSDEPNDLAERMKEVSTFVSENLEEARVNMKRFADRNRKKSAHVQARGQSNVIYKKHQDSKTKRKMV